MDAITRRPKMAGEATEVSKALYHYMVANSLREPAPLRALRQEASSMDEANWSVAPEQAQFMALLAEVAGVKRYLELGTFVGYGTLWMALALPPGAEIITCEIEPRFVEVAKRAWQAAGVDAKIDVRMGPAIDTLDALLADGLEESFDLAFIDADKPPYAKYYERCLRLVRPGGLILIDNVFWDGAVLDASDHRGSTRAIRNLNEIMCNDDRVAISTVPLGDGVTVARKHP